MNKRHMRIKGKAVTSFPSLNAKHDYGVSADMFAEDVLFGVMPTVGVRQNYTEFNVKVDGEKESNNVALRFLASGTRNMVNDNSWEEVVSELVKEISFKVAYHGIATFELLKQDENGEIVAISDFPPICLVSIPGYYMQIIPQEDREFNSNQKIIILPKRDVWSIEVPKALGGVREHKRMIRKLKRLETIAPDFMIGDSVEVINQVGLDYGLYRKVKEIEQWRLTRKWGWDHRDRNTRDKTECFIVFRNITFRWALAVLRESIIEEINDILRRIKLNTVIYIDGLPSSTQILGIREKMLKGDISFIEAIRLTGFN